MIQVESEHDTTSAAAAEQHVWDNLGTHNTCEPVNIKVKIKVVLMELHLTATECHLQYGIT